MSYILVDTREKDNAYVLKDFTKLEYNYKEQKLDEGDYQSSYNPNCVIDLKNGLIEVQSNIAGSKKNKARFLREVKRCIDKNKKLSQDDIISALEDKYQIVEKADEDIFKIGG